MSVIYQTIDYVISLKIVYKDTGEVVYKRHHSEKVGKIKIKGFDFLIKVEPFFNIAKN